MNWTIRIEYIAGEGPRDRMVRINKLVAQEKRDKGAQQITMSRNLSEISEALAETGQDQWVSLSDEERGSIARRSPTINLAANTGVKELDNYINKTLPDMKMLETYSSPRQRALSLALPSAVGVPRELRVPNIEAEDRLMAANILGSLPSGGMSLEESARNKLAATVKQALGDLGVGGSEVRSMLRDRLASRPFFNDPALVGNFSNMIKAYHDIREYNLHYAQALVPGLKAVKDPQRLTGALLPSPDSILNGTTAYLIYNYGEAPTITDFKGYVREALMKLLNLGPAPKGIAATTKQLQVGKLLSEFDFDRKKAAKALMKAVDQAMSRGGDFASAYAELEHMPTESNADITIALNDLENRFNNALGTYKEAIDFDKSIISYSGVQQAGPVLPGQPPLGDADNRAFFEFLVKEQVIFEVSENFFLIPVVLPSFDVDPVGWDRRWMIATMKIIDEYWDMIYNDNRKILLQDLLFLIATRTKELFNYDIDVVQMTILTLLITPESPGARRRARSILPKNAGGEVPLRSLTQLIKSSTKDEQSERPVQEEDRVLELENELNLAKLADETKRADLKHIQKGIRGVVGDLKSYGGDIQREHFVNDPAKVNAFMPRLKAIFDPLDAAIDTADNGANLAVRGAEAIKALLQDFEAGKSYENWDSKDLVESRKKLIALLPYSKTKMTQIGTAGGPAAGLVNLIGYATELGLKIEKQKEDPPDSGTLVDRAADEVAGDIYDQRKRVRARRRGRTRSKTTGMKEIGFVTAEVVVGTNVFKDVGMGIRDLVGGRSSRLEKMVNESLKLLVAELYERAESMGGDYVGDIAIQPIVYGGATMLTLIAHGVAYDTGGKKVKSNPPFGPFKKSKSDNQGKIYAGRFSTLDEITQAMERLAGMWGWGNVRYNGAYRDGNYGATDQEARGKLTEIFYEIQDMAVGNPRAMELARDIELSLAALPNPTETGRTDSYDAYTLAKSAAVAQANKEGETVYLWREGGKVKVSMFFPGKIDPREVTAIQPNPPYRWTGYKGRHALREDPDLIGPGHPKYDELVERIYGLDDNYFGEMGVFNREYMEHWGDNFYFKPSKLGYYVYADDTMKRDPDDPIPRGINPVGEIQDIAKVYGRVDAFGSLASAEQAAQTQANQDGATVYLWEEGGMHKVGMGYPKSISSSDVTAIRPNPPPVWRFKEASMKKYRDIEDFPWVYPGQTNHGGIFEIFQNARNAPQNYEKSDIYFDMQMPGRQNEIDVFYLDREEEAMLLSRFTYIGTLKEVKKLGNANPPSTERKYKGMIISKVDDGWEVDAYGKVFKTLKEARDFISKKVKGTAAPNQQCVRIIAGTRCVGTIVKLNQGGHYQCKKCKAKYRAV